MVPGTDWEDGSGSVPNPDLLISKDPGLGSGIDDLGLERTSVLVGSAQAVQ